MGPVSNGLPQPIGMVAMSPVLTAIAPVVESALPSNKTPVAIFIAALLAIIFPLILVPTAMLTAPSTNQNTLHAFVPLISTTSAAGPVAKSAPNWNKK